MKSFIALLLLAASCVAQEIAVEPITTEDLLCYLHIEPSSVAAKKFSLEFASPKFAALSFRKTVAGKEVETHRLPLGPSSRFVVEVFLAPADGKTGARSLHYKLSSPTQGLASSRVIDFPIPGSGQTSEYMLGHVLPLVFSCNFGDTLCTLSVTSSDSPIKKRP